MSKVPPAFVMNCACPPLAVFWKAVMPPLFVTTIALPAVLLSLNSNTLPLLMVMLAAPAVLALTKKVFPPVLLLMFAVPAVLLLENSTKLPAPLFVIVAFPAVLAFSKNVPPPPELLTVGAFDELFTTPLPLISSAARYRKAVSRSATIELHGADDCIGQRECEGSLIRSTEACRTRRYRRRRPIGRRVKIRTAGRQKPRCILSVCGSGTKAQGRADQNLSHAAPCANERG